MFNTHVQTLKNWVIQHLRILGTIVAILWVIEIIDLIAGHRLEGGEVGQPQIEVHSPRHGELARAAAEALHGPVHGRYQAFLGAAHPHRVGRLPPPPG